MNRKIEKTLSKIYRANSVLFVLLAMFGLPTLVSHTLWITINPATYVVKVLTLTICVFVWCMVFVIFLAAAPTRTKVPK